MSSGQKPRTPDHFPRMKYRARFRNQRQSHTTGFPMLRIDHTRLQAAVTQFADAMQRVGESISRFQVTILPVALYVRRLHDLDGAEDQAA